MVLTKIMKQITLSMVILMIYSDAWYDTRQELDSKIQSELMLLALNSV